MIYLSALGAYWNEYGNRNLENKKLTMLYDKDTKAKT